MMFLAVLPAPRRGSGSGSAPGISSSDSRLIAEVNAMSAADSPDAVLISATGLTSRSVSAFGIASLTARVVTEVPAISVMDYISGFTAT